MGGFSKPSAPPPPPPPVASKAPPVVSSAPSISPDQKDSNAKSDVGTIDKRRPVNTTNRTLGNLSSGSGNTILGG